MNFDKIILILSFLIFITIGDIKARKPDNIDGKIHDILFSLFNLKNQE